MKILALTGSIGMGKSTVAAMLWRLRIPVHCADDTVHGLLSKGGEAVAAVAALYPPAYDHQTASINRAVLGAVAFHDPVLMRRLENILHPLVRKSEKRFVQSARSMRKRLVALDIPLLFETQGERRADYIMVVLAPRFIQEQRVLKRPGMNRARLNAIRARQTPDHLKCRQADVVIPTGAGKAITYAKLRACLQKITNPIK